MTNSSIAYISNVMFFIKRINNFKCGVIVKWINIYSECGGEV